MRYTLSSVLAATPFFPSLTACDRYASNRSPKIIDAPQVAANFPDVKGIELLSPAFADPSSIPPTFANGTSGPTPQDVMVQYLKHLSRSNQYVTYHESEALQSEETRSIPYITLSNGKSGQKVRIWIQGGMHGDEPAGDQAVLALIGKLAADNRWAAKVLEKVDLLLLPRYNSDGVEYFQRALASNYDGNRDHAILVREQTRKLKRLQSSFDPHIVVDQHEYTGVGAVASKYIRAQDILVSANKNQNIHKAIRALNQDIVEKVFSAVGEKGLRYGPYFTTSVSGNSITINEADASPAANHKNAGLGQTVTFLTETRGIRLSDQHFQRRVATALIASTTIIDTAVNDFENVYKTIEDSRKAFIDSRDDIVVLDEQQTTSTSITFIDATSGALSNVTVTSKNSDPPNILITRARPKAYVFSRAWADVAERLRILGVRVDVLQQDYVGTVEALTIASADLASTKFEGIAATTVTTTAATRNVSIPKGGFWVDTKQKNAAFTFVLLEPEHYTSQVHYNAIPVEKGDEYLVFRVV
ncbi:hypothetical protein PMIN06_001432 [Paraphaeosphaeria minitans]|uniref:Carboxypeptidase M14B n=1 Tax=Paraphaeosphaeria minitans TaxID=565426 RepID=A0A9P6KWQ0_9PLEO|nr:carboxypeptidase 2 [Paraphaeosphaeria minitans]